MKTIGLLGGMSWESSTMYYQLINRSIQECLGGLHSAKILMYSFNFQEVASLQHSRKWEELGNMLADAARSLELGGAECIAICSNTMHKSADVVSSAVAVPLIHIGQAAAQELQHQQLKQVALLGTSFTMEQDFYKQSLENAGINVLIPRQNDRQEIHRIIFDELCQGELRDTSRETLLGIMEDLQRGGAQGAVLGCTELPLLVTQSHTALPLFDTTRIHSDAIVSFSLGENKS